MRNRIRFVALFMTVCIVLFPIASSALEKKVVSQPEETEKLICYIGVNKVVKELPEDTIEDIIALGESCKDAFLTIYDKTKTESEVDEAFLEIQPFFQALFDNDLTDKTVPELEALYRDIRECIRKPRNAEASYDSGNIQSTGIWNGVPTPVWANVLCGIFDAGGCLGFAFGTHTLVPTIGVDLFITYTFTGTSTTVGGFGFTMAVAAFQVIIGFIGVLIVTPGIMAGPYFMTGLCGAMFGIGA